MPTAGQVFPAPGAVTLRATATPTSGSTITKVEFYRGGSTLVGTVNGSSTPHTFNWSSVAAGSYSITARAYDSTGNRTSSAVAITVRTPPTVSLTAPAAGATFTAGSNITVSANASAASGGSVSNVKFYRDSTQIGSNDTSSPYSVTWSSAPAGTYSITAVVTDSTGLTKTSAARTITVNPPAPPTASLTAPSDGATFTAGANITISANATAGSGSLTHVRFTRNDVAIGSPDTSSPYSISWTNVAAGTYIIRAIARNSGGVETTSAPRTITVNAPPPPTVSLTAPADGATFPVGANITISATATAGTGTLSHVRFLRGATQIGSNDTSSPYSVTWSNAPAGTYALTAIARNSGGVETTSATRTITVSPPYTPPTATITSPTAGALYSSPATIDISATASTTQPGVTITRVDFFNGATKIGEDSEPPYAFSWPNRPAGSYSLKAVAVDSTTGTGSSVVVPVIVDGPDSCVGAPPLASVPPETQLASFRGPAPYFEANLGQVNEAVRFRRSAPGYQLFLTDTERVVSLRGGRGDPRAIALRLRYVGSNPKPAIEGVDEVRGRSNYLVGRDESRWKRQVPNYAQVRYNDLYPGIDEVYRADNGSLEYDLHVAPGKDPGVVRFSIEGAERAEIGAEGDLVLTTGRSRFTHKRPIAYQDIAGQRRLVPASYRQVSEREFGFSVGAYDPDHALVIDPVLVYSTLLGGTDDSTATGIALSRCGEVYVTGWTWAPDFPTTAGAYDTAGEAESLMGFVSKLNPSGSALMYSTYVTGATLNPNTGSIAQVTQPAAIALDATGHAYIVGMTEAQDFPTTVGSWFPEAPNDVASFLTKLNSDGSGLIYSSYVPIESLTGVAIDSGNNAYVTGEGRVWKINPQGSDQVYFHTLTSGYNTSTGIAVDAAGSAYVVGGLSSQPFTPTSGSFQATKPSATSVSSAWIAKLNAAGTSPIYATYVGTNGESFAKAVTVDGDGNAFVAGYASAGAIPGHTGPTALFSQDTTNPDNRYAFVAKVNPAGSQLGFYSRFGGSECTPICFPALTVARGVALDPAGKVWIAGDTASNRLDLPRGLYATPSLGVDVFAAKLSATGTTLEFGTLITGQTNGDPVSGAGIKVDSAGSAYVAGTTAQSDFPVTAGAFQTTQRVAGVRSAFVSKINENKDSTTSLAVSPALGSVGSPSTLTATITGNAPTGTVTFRDGSNVIGTGSVSSGTAALTTSALAAGVRSLTAAYGGDLLNNPSTSAAVSYAVADPQAPATLTISGISDGQMITAAASGIFSGGSIGVNVIAGFGNTIVNVIIQVDDLTYTLSPNQASWTGNISLLPLGVGVHTIRGIATDNNGNSARAAPIRFVVNAVGATPPASIAITSPAPGATLSGPATFTVSATGDASVSTVRFYANSQLIGTDGVSPYSVSWTDPPAGTYSLVAVANTTSNASRVSAPVSVTVTGPPSPTITLTAPANGAEFWVNQPVAIAASASAAGTASITKVEFYDNEQLKATRTDPPYELTLLLAAGTHSIYARAYDSLGQVAESKRSVVRATPAAAPTVELTAPGEGAVLPGSGPITFSATAGAAAGATITKVDFYVGATVIGTATASPYSVSWTTPIAGTHHVMAVATDSRFQTASSATRTITVAPPLLAIAAAPGLDGATVSSETLLIHGTIQAPRNSGVTVNGMLAVVNHSGSFFVNDVPLKPGPNQLALIVTTQDGSAGSSTISINREGVAPFTVEVDSAEGIGTHISTFRTSGGGVPIDSIEFDFDGNGTVDYFANNLADANVVVEFQGSGLRVGSVTFKHGGAVIQVVRKNVLVWAPENLYPIVKGVYDDLVSRLQVPDVQLGLNTLVPERRQGFEEIFSALGSDLQASAAQLGEFKSVTLLVESAEGVITRPSQSGSDAFFVNFVRGKDGIWRIDGM